MIKIMIKNELGAVLVARNDLKIEANIMSDSACLHKMISAALLAAPARIHFMRDVTRGGLATVAAECAKFSVPP